MKIRVGHTPDTDDACMFYGLVHGLVETGGLEYEHVLEPMQALSQRALVGELEMTAMSLFSYAQAYRHYRLLATGVSFGHGYGPRIVVRPGTTREQVLEGPIAIPGPLTTAYLVSQMWAGRPYPATPVRFDRVMDEVVEGRARAALIIHEGQLTFGDLGLELMVDLGAWWAEETGGLPLPLGVNGVRRDLSDAVAQQIADTLDASIRAGLESRQAALGYAMQFGRGIDERLGSEFVQMYVNESTLSLDATGEQALHALLERAAKSGLCPAEVPLDLVRATSAARR